MLKFAYIGKNNEMFISNFLVEKNFELMNIHDLLKIKENRMILIDNKISVNKIQEIAQSFNSNKNIITIFLLPEIRKEIKFNDYICCVFYPIKINDFKNIVSKKINNHKISFKDIFLDKRGFIVNKKNNLKIYLTETEQDILNFLISKHNASKNNIKKEILNLNPLVDTRSLESHLSRIRKKIKEIDSALKIISIDRDNIQIT